MANSFSVYTVQDGVDTYNIGFEYLRDEYLRVKINDVEQTGFTVVSNGTQVDISSLTTTAGDTLKIYRITPIADDDRLVQWLDGAFLNQDDLDTAQVQLLHAIQELVENPADTTTIVGLPAGGAADYVLTKVSASDYDVAWEAAAAGTGLPNGGTQDQVIVKQSSTDGDVAWETLDASDVNNDAVGFSATDVAGALQELLNKAGVTSWNTRTGAVVPVAGDYGADEVSVGTWAGGTHDYVLDALNFLFNNKAGAGDVFGPNSSTNNALARFDGSTGKTIQNSLVTLGDLGDLEGVNTITIDNASVASARISLINGTSANLKAGAQDPQATSVAGVDGDLFLETTSSQGTLWVYSNGSWVDALSSGGGSLPTVHSDNQIVRMEGANTGNASASAVTIADAETHSAGSATIGNVHSIEIDKGDDTSALGLSLLDITFTDTADNATSRNVKFYVSSEDPSGIYNPGTSTNNAGAFLWRVDQSNSTSNNESTLYIRETGSRWKKVVTAEPSIGADADHLITKITNSSTNSTKPDTDECAELRSTGTNGAFVNIFVGDRSPEGQSFGVNGDIYFRDSGISGNGIYVKSRFNNWVPFLHKEQETNSGGGTWDLNNSTEATVLPDTIPVLRLSSKGTNAGDSRVFVGDREPVHTGQDGDLYIRDDGTNSSLYIWAGTAWNNIGSINSVLQGPDDSTEILTLENVGTNSGNMGFYVGNRNPDNNVSATEADIYFDSTGADAYICQGTNNWNRLLTSGDPQGAREFVNIRSGGNMTGGASIRVASTPSDPTTDNVEWQLGSLIPSTTEFELQESVVSGGYDQLKWAGTRTIDVFLDIKVGIQESNTVSDNSSCLFILYRNNSVEASASGYFQSYYQGSSGGTRRTSGAFGAVLTLAPNDVLELRGSVINQASGSSMRIFSNGCAITIVELKSSAD